MLCGTRAISARSVGICDGVPSTARSSFYLGKYLVIHFVPALTNSICPVFLIVRFSISVSFRYFGFVSVNLGTVKLKLWPKVGLTYAISIVK